MKILLISMHYRPEPCDSRTSQLAAHLAERGHQVTSLTSFPNYPFGKVYEGYKQSIVSKKSVDGVTVVRVPMFADHSLSKKRRALSYLSFCLSASVLGSLFTRRPDVMWIHHPPLTTAIAGWFIAKVKRVPYVLEIHDLWPETLTSTGMIKEGRVTHAIRRVCKFLYKGAQAIVVTSPGMKSHLERQNVEPEKIHVIYQWADEKIYKPMDRDPNLGRRFGLENKFNVVFAGNLGVAQGLDTVLDAAKRLRDQPEIQFVLIGSGVESGRLLERVAAEGIENVRFLGQFNAKEMPKLMAWADGVLIHLRHDPLFAITIPSKTQTSMACGRPIICGVEGDGADIIDEARCGFTFEPECASDMERAIRAMHGLAAEHRDVLGRNARKAFERHFGQIRIMDKYETIFAAIAGPVRGLIRETSDVEDRLAA